MHHFETGAGVERTLASLGDRPVLCSVDTKRMKALQTQGGMTLYKSPCS